MSEQDSGDLNIVVRNTHRNWFFYALGLGLAAVGLWYLNMQAWIVVLLGVSAAFSLLASGDRNKIVPQRLGDVGVSTAIEPRQETRRFIVKTYRGSQVEATAAFRTDSAEMAAQGYFPTSQSWVPGSYGFGAFLMALLLCIVLIGIIAFIYMLIVKPDGTLSVTYEVQAIPATSANKLSIEEKTCPKCAEQVKARAMVCRFCAHEFSREAD